MYECGAVDKKVFSGSSPDVQDAGDGVFSLDPDQKALFDRIETERGNFFIQGQAGTGKSSFIRYLREHSRKRVAVASPTAVAAINVGGVTIHSMFELPLSDFIILRDVLYEKHFKLPQILAGTDLLVIDEVSMVRPDILDAVDALSRHLRFGLAPFGGLQVVLVGDLCQLPPVIKPSVSSVYKEKYGSDRAYFFDAHSYAEGKFEKCEFTRVYRQQDAELLENLKNLRWAGRLGETLSYFNSAKISDGRILDTAVTITPYRSSAERLNRKRLAEIKSEEICYDCETAGKFDGTADTPAPRKLILKTGALVIFNRNDSQGKRWINGSSGTVEKLGGDEIEILLSGGEKVSVKREVWESHAYGIDPATKEVVERVTGTFKQFPLQLGYALTIHKAQGKTLDKVIIDISGGAFAHGQLYVALSRTRKKSDMHIKNRITESDFITDGRVIDFMGRDRK